MTIAKAVSEGIVDNETLGYYMARTHLFLISVGIAPDKLRFRQHLSNEMAHYAKVSKLFIFFISYLLIHFSSLINV